MAISESYAGSEAVSTVNEWSLTTDTAGPDAQTDDGVYQVFLDVSDMVLTDVLRIRVYEKVGSASTQRIVAEWILRDVQAEPVWVSPTFIFLHGWDVTAITTAGTVTLDWSIRKVV